MWWLDALLFVFAVVDAVAGTAGVWGPLLLAVLPVAVVARGCKRCPDKSGWCPDRAPDMADEESL